MKGRAEGKLAKIIERARRLGHIKDGLVICDNCDTPASRNLSIATYWTGCAPCMTGESDSFDATDLIYAGIADNSMCICPELENLADGARDYDEYIGCAQPSRRSCPVHGAVLYGGEPLANVAEGADGKEPECLF